MSETSRFVTVSSCLLRNAENFTRQGRVEGYMLAMKRLEGMLRHLDQCFVQKLNKQFYSYFDGAMHKNVVWTGVVEGKFPHLS